MFTKKGFTLIELLVVVLIIGILAAIAVPQYQKAVEKSQVMQAVTSLKALVEAEEIYFLQNGLYATSLDDLDIKLPKLDDWSFTLSQANGPREDPQFFIKSKKGYLYILYYVETKQMVCQTRSSEIKYQKLCASLNTYKADCYGIDKQNNEQCYFFN